jgi:tetratricopeptide (TPR) repeat protein
MISAKGARAVAVLVLAALFSRAETNETVELELWLDPEFQKQFLGTYGVRSEIEPRVTPEERGDFEQVAKLMFTPVGTEKALVILEKSVAKAIDKTGRSTSSALYDFTIGNIYFQQDNVGAAEKWYCKAVEKMPSFLRAQKNLGLVYVRSNAFDKAIGPLTRAIDLGAADGLTFGLLAHSYSMTEQYVAAESAYRQAMMFQPEAFDWKVGLVRCLFKEAKLEEAAALCGDMIRRDPSRADLWLLQANAWLGLRQPLKAAENFELLDRAGLATVASLNTLGDIYVNEGVPSLAVDAYLRALSKDGDNAAPAVFMRHAEVLAARGAQAEAGKLLARVKEVCGSRLDAAEKKRALKLEARMAAANGTADQEQARLLESIVALDPLDGEALILLAQFHARAGETDKACFLCERASGIESYEAEAKLRHGQILVKSGKYAEALPLLKRSHELKPREDVERYIEQVARAAKRVE